MKLTKKISAIIACSAIMFNSITAVCASAANDNNIIRIENEEISSSFSGNELTEPVDDTPIIMDANYPTSVWDFRYNGIYDTFNGSAPYSKCYSLYLFTGSTTMGVGLRNDRTDGNSSVVYVYRKQIGLDALIQSIVISAGGTVHRAINGLSENDEYYLVIKQGSSVHGYVNEVVVPSFSF